MTQQAPPAPIQEPQIPSSSDLSQTIRNAVGAALSAGRGELEASLQRLQEQQRSIQANLDASTSSAQKTGLRAQLADVNAKIAKTEAAVARLNARSDQLTSELRSPSPGMAAGDVAPMVVGIVGIIFIGFPLAIAFARGRFRRGAVASAPALGADSTRRFDQLEQAIDAIAIEVERISENQRYLTKVLSEPRKAEIAAGPGNPQKL